MSKIIFAKVAFFSLIMSLAMVSCSSGADESPNIVIIMADDLGYGDVGCYGSEWTETPAIDRLAEEGMRFTDFHSNGANCTPTRAALMTGRYQQRAGLEGVIYVRGETRQTGLDPSETTLAEMFSDAGYVTGIMGKWHLGYRKKYNPVLQGFDTFHGYVSGNIDYHSHYDNAGIFDWWHNLDTVRENGYVTDLITDHSIDFIRENRDQPFFLYVPHEAPHVPFQGRSDSAYRYPGREFSYLGPVEDQEAAYREMVEVMDEGIGRIMQTLNDLQLDKKTFVIFCSDNGSRFGSNGPLRGAKGSLWEGGHRVPAIARYPGIIEAGAESSAIILSMDLAPTLLAVAGIEQSHDFDGVDFSAHMYEREPLESRPVFWRYREQATVRKGSWKYLKMEGEEYLFNLEEDLTEENNRVDQHPEITGEMKTLLEKWQSEMNRYQQKTN